MACENDQRDGITLRAPTGKVELIRVDQVDVTPALKPTIRDYRLVASNISDHDGLLAPFDLSRTDHSQLRPCL